VRCYAHGDCVARQRPTWYPATRWAVFETSPLGKEIAAHTYSCPEGSGELLQDDAIVGVLASDSCVPQCKPVTMKKFGFDQDAPGEPSSPLAVSATLPCGLPYKYELIGLADNKDPSITNPRLVKNIVFEQWFENYWQFDETALTYVKKRSLQENPQYGAVPPFPDSSTITSNYDSQQEGGQITGGDFGCKMPEMHFDLACPNDNSRPLLVVLQGEPSHIAANLRGYGTIVTGNDLMITAGFEYWGTILIDGTFVVGAGTPTIRGSVIVKGPMQVAGNFTLEHGEVSIPVGPSVVVPRAWWER